MVKLGGACVQGQSLHSSGLGTIGACPDKEACGKIYYRIISILACITNETPARIMRGSRWARGSRSVYRMVGIRNTDSEMLAEGALSFLKGEP